MGLRHICVVFFVLAACDGLGGGCAGCDDLPLAAYPDPAPAGGEVQQEVVAARVTQNALDFFTRNLDILLGTFFEFGEERVEFFIDESLFPPDSPVLIRSEPVYPSAIAFDKQKLIDGVKLQWLQNDGQGRPGIRFAIEDFELFVDLALHLDLSDQSLGQATCHMRDNGMFGAVQVDALAFELRLTLDDTGSEPTITLVVDGTPEVLLSENAGAGLEGMMVDPCNGTATSCSDPICVSNPEDCEELCDIGETFTELGGFLVGLLEPLLHQLTPILAEEVSGLLADALEAVPLQLEAQFDLAELLGAFFRNVAPIHVKVAPSAEITVQGAGPGGGLQLGLHGGVTSAEVAHCASAAAPPDLAALVGSPPVYTGFIEVFPYSGPPRIEPYHIAVGIAESLLAQASWGAFQSGLVCLDVDAYGVESLAGDAFPFTAGLLTNFDIALSNVAHPDAPLLLTIRPTAEPEFHLGAGKMIADDVFEPLLEVVVDNLELGIYMLVDEAMHRVSALEADLVVSFGVERTPNQAIELVVDSIQFANIDEVYNEMAPGAEIGPLLELVVDLAVGTLLGDSLRFEVDLADTLSSALGVPVSLRLNDLRRDIGPDGAKYLSVYATLCDEAALGDATQPACFEGGEPTSRNVALALGYPDEASMYEPTEPQRHDAHRWDAIPSGKARFPVLAGTLSSEHYEYQFRVDGGPWSTFKPAEDGHLEVRSPRLKVAGYHTVEVRARHRDNYMSRTDAQSVSFWVDRERPYLRAFWSADEVVIHAFDAGTPAEALAFFAQFDADNDWHPVAPRFFAENAAEKVTVVARDLAGNVSHPHTLWRVQSASPSRPAATLAQSMPRSGGCHAAGTAPQRWLMWIAILLLRPRRQRKRAF